MLIQNILYYDEAGAVLIPLIFPSADESNIPESDTVYGDLESRRFTAVNFEPPHRRNSLSRQDARGYRRKEFCSDT
jgi:hypothetical protein